MVYCGIKVVKLFIHESYSVMWYWLLHVSKYWDKTEELSNNIIVHKLGLRYYLLDLLIHITSVRL